MLNPKIRLFVVSPAYRNLLADALGASAARMARTISVQRRMCGDSAGFLPGGRLPARG
jgi:hypothetical protein